MMPAAFRIVGAPHSHFDGTYTRLSMATCNGKPVYQLDGSDGYVLFQPERHSFWIVGDRTTDCHATGYIESSGNGGSCAARARFTY